MTDASTPVEFSPLLYDHRYYVHTAKSSISGLVQIIGEAISNSDEAIRRRSERDGVADEGRIVVSYDPETMVMSIVDDGKGMTATEMLDRLRNVGKSTEAGAVRGFFHRGIRDVFLAMGGGEVLSIGRLPSGEQAYSQSVFDPDQGIAMVVSDAEPDAGVRAELGIDGTGTLVRFPLARFAKKKPKLFAFSEMERSIRDCVQVRPIMEDANRDVSLKYGDEPPRRLRFESEAADVLLKPTSLRVGGFEVTLWANASKKRITSSLSKQLRRSGILIRGERAAYEVSLGDKLRSVPAMQMVYGELRIDSIEEIQRAADDTGDDDALLVYKSDRSGLNADHPLVEAICEAIDNRLGPLVAKLEDRGTARPVSGDVRRQLQRLARLINEAVKNEDPGNVTDPGADPQDPDDTDVEPPIDSPEPPPPPPEPIPRDLDAPIMFPHDRVFVNAGVSRTVELWIDPEVLDVGTPIVATKASGREIQRVRVSADAVPEPDWDGVSTVRVTIAAGADEGREEISIRCGDHVAVLPVHIRYPRASGFISQIILDDRDWEAGSALYDPSTGRVSVFVGRPEFKDVDRAAKRAGVVPMKFPLYQQLVVESVREAALRPAAQRRAEVEWDDLSADERADKDAFLRLVIFEYQALDYLLRNKLLRAFVTDA